MSGRQIDVGPTLRSIASPSIVRINAKVLREKSEVNNAKKWLALVAVFAVVAFVVASPPIVHADAWGPSGYVTPAQHTGYWVGEAEDGKQFRGSASIGGMQLVRELTAGGSLIRVGQTTTSDDGGTWLPLDPSVDPRFYVSFYLDQNEDLWAYVSCIDERTTPPTIYGKWVLVTKT